MSIDWCVCVSHFIINDPTPTVCSACRVVLTKLSRRRSAAPVLSKLSRHRQAKGWVFVRDCPECSIPFATTVPGPVLYLVQKIRNILSSRGCFGRIISVVFFSWQRRQGPAHPPPLHDRHGLTTLLRISRLQII